MERADEMRAETPNSVGLICPACRVDLVMSDRQGIEIDYCPRCRGVWLDRGELDKIIEKSTAELQRSFEQTSAPLPPARGGAPGPWSSAGPAQGCPPDRGYDRDGCTDRYSEHGGHGGHDRHGGHGGHGRHGSFLTRLFD